MKNFPEQVHALGVPREDPTQAVEFAVNYGRVAELLNGPEPLASLATDAIVTSWRE